MCRQSNEIKELVASALTANYKTRFGPLPNEDDFLSKDISINNYDQKLDRYSTLTSKDFFDGKFSISLFRHRKSKNSESSRTGTISFFQVRDGLRKIKDSYDKAKAIYPHMHEVKEAIKSSDPEKLANIVQKIIPNSQMTEIDALDNIKYIYKVENENKKRSILGKIRKQLKSTYHKLTGYNSKSELDNFF